MQTSKSYSNIDTVKQLYDLFNQRKWQDIAALHTDKVYLLDSKIGDQYVIRKKADLALRYAAVERKYPGIKDHILFIQESGNMVYVQYMSKGYTRDGQPWEQLAWNIFTVEHGKITRVATYFSQPE
ncbi:nuclear transport factor 2 family protein [Chitinophagaceae bacterium MMS25-I14]